MKRGFFYMLCTFASVILVSCLGNAGGSTASWSANYQGTLTVTDMNDAVVYSKEEYKVTAETANMIQLQPKLQLTFTDFKLEESMTPLTLVFVDVPSFITIPDDDSGLNYIVDVASATPYVDGVAVSEYEVEKLQGTIGKTNVQITFTMKQQPYKVKFTIESKQ